MRITCKNCYNSNGHGFCYTYENGVKECVDREYNGWEPKYTSSYSMSSTSRSNSSTSRSKRFRKFSYDSKSKRIVNTKRAEPEFIKEDEMKI